LFPGLQELLAVAVAKGIAGCAAEVVREDFKGDCSSAGPAEEKVMWCTKVNSKLLEDLDALSLSVWSRERRGEHSSIEERV
jgi:hypothetical protein